MASNWTLQPMKNNPTVETYDDGDDGQPTAGPHASDYLSAPLSTKGNMRLRMRSPDAATITQLGSPISGSATMTPISPDPRSLVPSPMTRSQLRSKTHSSAWPANAHGHAAAAHPANRRSLWRLLPWAAFLLVCGLLALSVWRIHELLPNENPLLHMLHAHTPSRVGESAEAIAALQTLAHIAQQQQRPETDHVHGGADAAHAAHSLPPPPPSLPPRLDELDLPPLPAALKRVEGAAAKTVSHTPQPAEYSVPPAVQETPVVAPIAAVPSLPAVSQVKHADFAPVCEHCKSACAFPCASDASGVAAGGSASTDASCAPATLSASNREAILDTYTFESFPFESAVGPGIVVRIWERDQSCALPHRLRSADGQAPDAPVSFFRVSTYGTAFAAVDSGPLMLGGKQWRGGSGEEFSSSSTVAAGDEDGPRVPSGHRSIIKAPAGMDDLHWDPPCVAMDTCQGIQRGLQTFLLLPEAGAYVAQVRLMFYDIDSGRAPAGASNAAATKAARMITENYPMHSSAYEKLIGGHYINEPLRVNSLRQLSTLVQQSMTTLEKDTVLRVDPAAMKDAQEALQQCSEGVSSSSCTLNAASHDKLLTKLLPADVAEVLSVRASTGALVVIPESMARKYEEKFNPVSLPLCGSPAAEKKLRDITRKQGLPLEEEQPAESSSDADVYPLDVAFNLRGRWIFRGWVLRGQVVQRDAALSSAAKQYLPRNLQWVPWDTKPLWYLVHPAQEIEKCVFVPYFCRVEATMSAEAQKEVHTAAVHDVAAEAKASRFARPTNLLELLVHGGLFGAPSYREHLSSAKWTHMTGDSNTRYLFDFTCWASGGQVIRSTMDAKRDPPVLCLGPQVSEAAAEKEDEASSSVAEEEGAERIIPGRNGVPKYTFLDSPDALLSFVQNTSKTRFTTLTNRPSQVLSPRALAASVPQVRPAFVLTYTSWFWGKAPILSPSFRWSEQCALFVNDNSTWTHSGFPWCDSVSAYLGNLCGPAVTWHGWGCHAAEFGFNRLTAEYFAGSTATAGVIKDDGTEGSTPFNHPYHRKYATVFPLTTAGNPAKIPTKFGRQQLMRNNERMWATNVQLSQAVRQHWKNGAYATRQSLGKQAARPAPGDWTPVIDTWSPTYAAFEWITGDAVHFNDVYSLAQPAWVLHWWLHAPNLRMRDSGVPEDGQR